METLAEKYVLLDSLLSKLVTTSEKETALLAIPETCDNKIITLCHSSLFAGHHGVIKMYLTIGDKFIIQGLLHYLKIVYKIYPLSKNEKLSIRQLQYRINLNYRPLSSLSFDLKVMARSHKGHKFILCSIDMITHYLISVPIYQSRSKEIGDALIENVISKYCIYNNTLYNNGPR